MDINKNIQTKKEEDPLTIRNLPLDLINLINRFLIIPREDFNKINDMNEMEETLKKHNDRWYIIVQTENGYKLKDVSTKIPIIIFERMYNGIISKNDYEKYPFNGSFISKNDDAKFLYQYGQNFIEKWDPIMKTIYNQHFYLFKNLLKNDIDINIQANITFDYYFIQRIYGSNHHNRSLKITSLELAVEFGLVKFVKLLLIRDGAIFNPIFNVGLFIHGKMARNMVNTCIYNIICKKKTEQFLTILELLLERSDINLIFKQNNRIDLNQPDTILSRIIDRVNQPLQAPKELITCLLKRTDIGINKKNNHGQIPIFQLLKYRMQYVVKKSYMSFDERINHILYLFEQFIKHPNIKINKTNSRGHTCIYEACQIGATAIVKILLNHKDIDLNIQTKQNGNTPLMAAIRENNHNLELIDILLECKDIDINLCDNHTTRRTALALAIRYGKVNIINKLLADPRIIVEKNRNYLKHIHNVGKKYRQEIIDILNNHKKDIPFTLPKIQNKGKI